MDTRTILIHINVELLGDSTLDVADVEDEIRALLEITGDDADHCPAIADAKSVCIALAEEV